MVVDYKLYLDKFGTVKLENPRLQFIYTEIDNE